ncbi:radiation-inducible immediate-early gene IEX-1 [Cheilinus undulatus]|uniref:radiation-inducible immediate-early gene IEX-1 n=1 Tax=Cheilinus undulatus TaxID=241271 RepID=UPI001BD6154A|nr:radiation-inducible immediate-early gene IEX-1 [Cheilinus undulatus]
MYSRTNSVTMTIQRERFAHSRTANRSTEPEVFTFERITPQANAVRSYVPIRPKKRCTRVMYPAKVRMHLPPPEKNQAKRWLVILCLVVLWQIYTEEPCADTPLSSAHSPAIDYQSFPFQCTEEQRRISELSEVSASQTSCEGPASSSQHIQSSSCPTSAEETESSLSYEQSAPKSYMVALLVYHRLGSDN